jgi:hypothetical protein
MGLIRYGLSFNYSKRKVISKKGKPVIIKVTNNQLTKLEMLFPRRTKRFNAIELSPLII